MWMEIECSASTALLMGNIYEYPAATYTWFDDFVEVMDKVSENNTDVILLGDFNIDLLKPQPPWRFTTSLFGLHQLIRCATRITQTTVTLLDHTYRTKNETIVLSPRVSDTSVTDRCPIACTWSCKSPGHSGEGSTTVRHRCVKHFDIVVLNTLTSLF